jgi:hypothetical protein
VVVADAAVIAADAVADAAASAAADVIAVIAVIAAAIAGKLVNDSGGRIQCRLKPSALRVSQASWLPDFFSIISLLVFLINFSALLIAFFTPAA